MNWKEKKKKASFRLRARGQLLGPVYPKGPRCCGMLVYWVEFNNGKAKIIRFLFPSPHFIFNSGSEPTFSLHGGFMVPCILSVQICLSPRSCSQVYIYPGIHCLKYTDVARVGGFCFSGSCFMTSLNWLESGLTLIEEIVGVYNHVYFAVEDNSGQGLTRKGITEITQCSHNISSYKCVPSGSICRSDWRAAGRPPRLNHPHRSYECLRFHSQCLIIPFVLKGIVGFSIKYKCPLRKFMA